MGGLYRNGCGCCLGVGEWNDNEGATLRFNYEGWVQDVWDKNIVDLWYLEKCRIIFLNLSN